VNAVHHFWYCLQEQAAQCTCRVTVASPHQPAACTGVPCKACWSSGVASLHIKRSSPCLPLCSAQYNDLGYAVHMYDFHGPLLLPKTYDTLAQTLFGPGTQHSIYMERLQPCSKR